MMRNPRLPSHIATARAKPPAGPRYQPRPHYPKPVLPLLDRAKTEREPPPEDDLAWMRWLDADIWEETAPTANSYGTILCGRGLTGDEKVRVLRIAREHRMIAQMGGGEFGLSGYSVSFYEHPAYPGVPPEYVICLNDKHWFGKGHKSDYEGRQGRYDEIWELFSSFSHSKQNQEWLKQHGLRPSRERSHYDY